MRRAWNLIVVAVALVAMASLAEACPTCKAALAGQQRYGNLPLAYMISILFMMSMPFLLLGSFAGYMYYQVRQARQKTASVTSTPLTTAPTSLAEPLTAAR